MTDQVSSARQISDPNIPNLERQCYQEFTNACLLLQRFDVEGGGVKKRLAARTKAELEQARERLQ